MVDVLSGVRQGTVGSAPEAHEKCAVIGKTLELVPWALRVPAFTLSADKEDHKVQF